MSIFSVSRTTTCPAPRSRPPLRALFDLARQRRALARLEDARLEDLGISRFDAETEARRPLWDVPDTWRD